MTRIMLNVVYAFSFIVLLQFSIAQDISHIFIPFGTQYGDKNVSKGDDTFQGPVPISISFPFFGSNFSSVFVNVNGLISFGTGIKNYVPDKFPVQGLTAVAPLWPDVDTRYGGDIYYRELTDRQTLNLIDTDLKRAFPSLVNFRSSWAFVTTWDQVASYGRFNPLINNSFQAIIATNSKYSFTIFNYGKLMWTVGTASHVRAQAGFNSGTLTNFFVLPGSFTDNVVNVALTSNININGKWIFRIDSLNITEGNCDSENGYLNVVPNSVYFVGIDDIIITGPCFNLTDVVKLEYDGKKEVLCNVTDASTCVCKTVYFDKIGVVTLKMTINNNATFTGVLSSKNLPLTTEINGIEYFYKMEQLEQVNISWSDTQYDQNANYSVYFITIKNNENEPTISILKDNNANPNSTIIDLTILSTLSNHFDPNIKVMNSYIAIVESKYHPVTLQLHLSVIKLQYINIAQTPENSDTFQNACRDWSTNQIDIKAITDSLPPCWKRITSEANGDLPTNFGEYIQDVTCNSNNPASCQNFHRTAKSCYRSKTLVGNSSQQCCYSFGGRLFVGPSGGGNLILMSPELSMWNHYINDVYGYYLCCKLSNLCNLYYSKRPSDNGARWQSPQVAGCSGDPHFYTLDQLSYLFNGFGEYVLLSIEGIIEIQVRMLPYMTQNRVPTIGTVFKAIAIKSSQSYDSVQVEIDELNLVDLFINGRFHDYSNDSEIELNGCSISLDENLFTIQYANGIYIEVKLTDSHDALLLVLVVDNKYSGKTKGLLGTMDNDKANDFLLPNGTTLNLDPTNDKDVFNMFGQQWLNTPQTSIFTYRDGFKQSDFVNKQFIPKFLSDGITFTNSTLEALAQTACQNNTACLFDINVTGVISIGTQNLILSNNIMAKQNQLNSANISCVPQSTIFDNGSVSYNLTNNGDYLYNYTCNSGYCMNGSALIKCINGTYDYNPPQCSVCKSILVNQSVTTTPVTTATAATPPINIIIPAVVIPLAVIIIIVCLLIVYYFARRHKFNNSTKSEKNHPTEDFQDNGSEIINPNLHDRNYVGTINHGVRKIFLV